MKVSHLTHFVHRFRHLVTIQNVGLVVVCLVALGWVWGAVATLQKNYQHQRQVDINAQQIELAKLQNQNYTYQQAYYRSDEFLELSARQKLGLAQPGEHLVLLPSSEGIKDVITHVQITTGPVKEQSNFLKWMNFFFVPRT